VIFDVIEGAAGDCDIAYDFAARKKAVGFWCETATCACGNLPSSAIMRMSLFFVVKACAVYDEKCCVVVAVPLQDV
jgi:hypothetical protein